MLILVTLSLAACDFFRELESAPGAEETGDTGDGDQADAGTGDTGSADEPCTVLDDRCSDQDTLHSCNFETGEIDTYLCVALCGQNSMNFTCTPTADFRHACWCVTPGAIKIDTCSQLEDCIVDCGGDPASPCTQGCFEQTDAQTARLLGTLYSCADRACDDLCEASPAECGACLIAAKAGLFGDCGLQREVCDSDLGDEPSWP